MEENDRNICFFDLETTGTEITKDRIVEISIIKTDRDLNVLDKFYSKINPTIPIPAGATKVHGISDEDVKDCPSFKDINNIIWGFIKSCDMGGYNIVKFDLPLLSEEFARCMFNYDLTQFNVIDGLKVFHQKEKRDLTAALKFYCGIEMKDAHKAENDVLATIEIIKGQMFMYDMNLSDHIESIIDKDSVDFTGNIKLIDGVTCFNFGKLKGKPITEIKKDDKYYQWICNADFPIDTKRIIRQVYERNC